MVHNPKAYRSMDVGVVLRRAPGVTKWATWVWRAVAVLPGAGPAEWRLLREEADISEFHAATCRLELHGAETEAYMHELSSRVPSVYVVMRPADAGAHPLEVALITASPYESQDYTDSGEDIVERVAMPPGLAAWVAEFVDAHHHETPFRKRRRDNKVTGAVEDGIGDPRIAQITDVYRSPALARRGRLQ